MTKKSKKMSVEILELFCHFLYKLHKKPYFRPKTAYFEEIMA